MNMVAIKLKTSQRYGGIKIRQRNDTATMGYDLETSQWYAISTK